MLLSRDGPGWLNFLVLLFIWDGFKMLRIDPVTLMLRRYIRTEPELEPEPDAEVEAEPEGGPRPMQTMQSLTCGEGPERGLGGERGSTASLDAWGSRGRGFKSRQPDRSSIFKPTSEITRTWVFGGFGPILVLHE